MNECHPDYLRPYAEAKAFWRWWQSDPGADLQVAEPWTTVEGMLTDKFGQHPREAAYTARIALDSVLDVADYQIA